MDKKINIADLLKDCPKGMKLDCTMYNSVTLLRVDDEKHTIFPIKVLRSDGCEICLTEYGQYAHMNDAKCVIFPKGKTTWDGFTPPCKFKDGDVLYVDCADEESDGDLYKYIFILKEIDSLGNYFSYCYLSIDRFSSKLNFLTDNRYTARFATEEEKQKLFQAIKDNGYKWNDENNTLEKLIEPKFKVGDRIKLKDYYKKYIIDEHVSTITSIKDGKYWSGKFAIEYINEQDKWELAKFDITTLKPFDKVLVKKN